MKHRPQVELVTLALGLTSCALQATSGPSWASQRRPAAVTISGTTESTRMSGGTLGARVGMAIDDGLVPKQGIVHAGFAWRAVPGWFVVEPGLDLGLGGPIASAYSGIGAYLGASTGARLRVCGVNDEETAFNVIASRIDVVLAGRAGAWAPPEGSPSTRLVGEYGLELGVRIAFETDIYSGPPGKVQNLAALSQGAEWQP